MSINHKTPRQDRRNIGRAPVKKHVAASIGTAPGFFNPPYKTNAAQRAALEDTRQKNLKKRNDQ